MTKLITPKKIDLLNYSDINEAMIQKKIADDPAILNLGDLVLKDKERVQPKAGRLDLLLQDIDTSRRYEVEIQLGKTDESHIIRTIEYWDIEKKRYPQYDHCAVIIAEDITSRFLNVINLFHGSIPLIAIQMKAFRIGEDVALNFTTVLDEMSLGMVDEDEETHEVADRKYWLERGTEETVKMADSILSLINEISDNNFSLKYNKFYIGLVKNGQANNFIILRPMKSRLNIEIRLPYSEEVQEKINRAELDDMGYLKKWNRYRLRLSKSDFDSNINILKELIEMSYKNSK